MFDWLVSNLGTISITLVLALVVALIIIRMIKNKKDGKPSCGCFVFAWCSSAHLNK